MNLAVDTTAQAIPEVTDADICDAERWLGAVFDEPRREILRSNDSFDVQACPGSGKTTLMVAKLAILASRWPHARRGMCVLSHTNVARREIERKLVGNAAGQRLLAYPHFVGTIHSFVNEFLALPALRSEGKTVRLIDDEASGNLCCRLLHSVRAYSGARQFLDRSDAHDPDRTIRALRYEGENLALGSAAGNLPCGPSSRSFASLSEIKQRASDCGLWRFDDMFAWAERLLAKHPMVADFARWRFPAVFIDEMQDTSEIQGHLLAAIFAPCNDRLRQRFGDSNQAIYEFGEKRAITDCFPSGEVRAMPCSLRFGASVAAKVEALAPDPPQPALVGEGPRTNLFSVQVDPGDMPHTVFLFTRDSARQVLPAFASLLLETFPDTVFQCDAFLARAIGRVGKPGEDDNKFPRCLSDYWTGYEPRAAKPEPRPQKLADYVHLAQRRRAAVVDCADSVRTVAKGLATLVEILIPGAVSAGGQPLPWLWESVEDDESATLALRSLLWEWCVELARVGQEDWLGQVDNLRRALRPIIGDRWDNNAGAFCQWSAEFAGDLGNKEAAGQTTPNRYRFTNANRFVDIDVGTIHSAKGQTHTATLVLETFYKKHDLEDLREWLLGNKRGANGIEGVERLDRMRLLYTAMTRPTHLLCLAMRQEAAGQGSESGTAVERLNALGWKVRIL